MISHFWIYLNCCKLFTAENVQKMVEGGHLVRGPDLECPKVAYDSIGASLETMVDEVFRQFPASGQQL